MPVYEYECSECEHVTEAIRRMDQADTPIVCEKCGSEKTARMHSVFSAGASGNGGEGDPGAMPPGGSCGTCGGMPGSCRIGM